MSSYPYKHRLLSDVYSKCSGCGSGSHVSISSPTTVKYTYNLPYNVRKSLCDLLDADQSWKRLGGEYMGLSETELSLIFNVLYRGESPTNALLLGWEKENPQVIKLIKYLFAMKHKRALKILLPFVDEKLRISFETSDEDEANTDDMEFMATVKPTRGATGGYNTPEQYHLNRGKMKATAPEHYATGELLKEAYWNNLNCGQRSHRGSGHSNHNISAGTASGNEKSLHESEEDLEVPYKELQLATNDFSDNQIIGSGGFGVVYRGIWKGTEVAIKRLKGCDNISQAKTELRALNRYRIDNILPLYGISLDGPEPCLLYQFMPNGSLEDRLLCKGNSPPLTWEQRAVIGEGIAKALNYLHTLRGKPMVHGDVKSANVLLDAQFQCKLGDFGLAKQIISKKNKGIATHVTVTSVHGTCVYLPSEYLRNKILSSAVDVYSYGVVMLEMATGRRAYDGKKLLLELVQEELNSGLSDESRKGACRLMDSRIKLDPEGSYWFNNLINLGVDCAQKQKSKRPAMSQILEYYERCRTRDRIRRLSAEFREEPTAIVREPSQIPYFAPETSLNQKNQISFFVPTTTVPCTVGETNSSFTQETSSSYITDDSCPYETKENFEPLPPPDENIEGVIPLITELGINDNETIAEVNVRP